MALRKLAPMIIRRAVVAAGVATLAITAVAGPATAGSIDGDTATIDTYTGWDGVSYLYPFGYPDTSTYGQVITVPAGKTTIDNFTFYLAADAGTGTLTVRGEVYGWDGTKATTKIFQSKAKSVDIDASDPAYYPVKIKSKHKAVTAGQQIVLFLTISKDWEENPSGVAARWAENYADVLPGAYTVYINDGGDESQWTTASWSQIPDWDFAMKANLS